MRKRWAGLIAVCAFAVFPQAPLRGHAQVPAPAESDSVIVRYEPTVEAQQAASDGHIPSLAEKGYRTVKVPEGMGREAFMETLRKSPGVVSVEPDAPVFAASVPNDIYYPGNQSPYMEQIGAPRAWDLSTGGKKIVVAVLDSGTDLGHPDLAGRLWENTADAVSDGVDHDGNGCINDRYGCRFINLTTERRQSCGYTTTTPTGAVLDDHGGTGVANHSHGTLVAGIIGAAGNNGLGITGMAWDVRIMTVKVLDCGVPSRGGEPSGDISNIAQGIDYARRMGANIINLSLASRSGDLTADTSILRDAIRSAQDAGVLIVAAVGNHTPGSAQVAPGYPAAYTQFQNIVPVAASDNLNGNTWAAYSNYGPTVALAAPGTNLVGLIRSDIGLANPYAVAGQGTSYATALASGMFVLMMARNPRLAVSDYVTLARLSASPAPPGPDNWAGAGIINAGAAVERVPMLLSGSALQDWKDAPASTIVQATIDGTECGLTVTSVAAGTSSYTIRVPSAQEQPGCGAPGKTVRLAVGGQPASPAVAWGGRGADLSATGFDISSVSPPPGATVTQALGGGWSQVAHLGVAGTMPGALDYLPAAWSGALSWDAAAPGLDRSGAYSRFLKGVPAYVNTWSQVRTYDAYWVNSPAASLSLPNPNPPSGRTIVLAAGWNNIVYTGTNRAVADALADIAGKYAEVLQYDNAAGRWLAHVPNQPRFLNDFGGLFQMKVYWIFMSEPGLLTMR